MWAVQCFGSEMKNFEIYDFPGEPPLSLNCHEIEYCRVGVRLFSHYFEFPGKTFLVIATATWFESGIYCIKAGLCRLIPHTRTAIWRLYTNYSRFLKIVSAIILFFKHKAINWKKNCFFLSALLVFGFWSSNQTALFIFKIYTNAAPIRTDAAKSSMRSVKKIFVSTAVAMATSNDERKQPRSKSPRELLNKSCFQN